MGIVERINEITRNINKVWESPQEISEQLLELSALNSKLGDELAEALDLERSAETQYKYELDKAKLDFIKTAKDSATVAESKAKIGLKEMLDEWVVAERNKNLMRLKYDSTKGVIDAIRSRLSLIKNAVEQGVTQ